LKRRLIAELDEDDPVAQRCFTLWASGMSAKDQAAALGCTMDRVLAAQTLIKRRAARIREEYDAAERDRMNAMRTAASTGHPASPTEGAKA
ncbi:MAG: hypothetical protein ACRENE_33260, partial [Polyangiaceae bacterium]